MGNDGSDATYGYCEVGSAPTFMIERALTGEIIELTGDVSGWEANGIFHVSTLETVADVVLPNVIELEAAYPNPFNPKTNLTYNLTEDGLVEFIIFDMNGRIVSELHNGFQTAGTYSYSWDATDQSSGVYFMQLTFGSSVETSKLLLLK